MKQSNIPLNLNSIALDLKLIRLDLRGMIIYTSSLEVGNEGISARITSSLKRLARIQREVNRELRKSNPPA